MDEAEEGYFRRVLFGPDGREVPGSPSGEVHIDLRSGGFTSHAGGVRLQYAGLGLYEFEVQEKDGEGWKPVARVPIFVGLKEQGEPKPQEEQGESH